MSRDLPRYSTTSGVEVGPALEVPQMYGQYKQMFGEIEEATRPIAQSYEQQMGQEQGEIAGQNPGFKTGTAVGIASRAYNQAGLAANRMYLASDAAKNIQTFKQQALGFNPDGSKVDGYQGLNPQEIENFNSKTKAYMQGQLETIPTQNRMAFTHYAAAQSTAVSSSLLNQFRTKQKLGSMIDLSNQADSLKQDILSKTSQGSPILDSLAQNELHVFTQGLDNEAIKSSLPFKYTQNLSKELKKSYLSGNILGVFNSKLNKDPQSALEYINQVRTSPDVISQFGEAGANAKASELKAIMNGRAQAEGVSVQNTNMMSKSMLMQSWSNPSSTPNQVDLQHITEHNALLGRQDQNDQLLKEMPLARQAGGYVQEFLNTSDGMQQNVIKDNLQKSIDNIDNSNPMSVRERYWDTQSQNEINKLEVERKKDLVGYIQKTSGYKALIHKKAAFSTVMKPEQDLQNQYVKNFQAEQQVDPQMYKIMSKDDMDSFSSGWSIGTQDKKNNLISGLTQKYGTDVGLALNQLSNMKHAPNGVMTYYTMAHNPDTVGKLQAFSTALSVDKPTAAASFKEEKKTWPDAVADIKQAASPTISLFSTQPGFDPNQIEKRAQSLAYYASYLMYTDNQSYPDAVQQAADLGFNNQTNTGSFNGQNYAIPITDIYANKIDHTVVPAIAKTYALSKLDQGVMTDPAFRTNGLNANEANSAYKDDLKLDGYWANTQGGLMFMNSMHTPVRGVDGNPIKMSWGDIGDPSSAPYMSLTLAKDNIINKSKKRFFAQSNISPADYDEFANKQIENQSMFSGDPYHKQVAHNVKLISEGLGRDVSKGFKTPPGNKFSSPLDLNSEND